jgi:hypothetical protein
VTLARERACGTAPALFHRMMIRFLAISSGVLLLASLAAFFLVVPLLSLATVVCMLTGLVLMFGLGMQFGTLAPVSDRSPSPDRRPLLLARACFSTRGLSDGIKSLFGR